MARDPDAVQLRAVTPLVANGNQVIGPVMLVTNGHKTIGITSAEIARPWAPAQLAVALGARLLPIANFFLGRYANVVIVEFAEPITATADVVPLDVSAICATVDTRGAPSALVTITEAGRTLIPVHVDKTDGGGMSDEITRLASPIDAAHASVATAGAILFSWFPPDPVLGRPSEVLAVAIAYPYTQGVYQPRELPPIAELSGLEDLGRALIKKSAPPDERPELHAVTGEIAEARVDEDRPVLDPVDEIRKQREST